MHSHLVLLLIFASCVSAVFAGLMREDTREQVVLGAKMFGAMIGAALMLGWVMFPFPL